MKAYMVVSELGISKTTRTHFGYTPVLHAGLMDFYGKTRSDLKRLVDLMLEYKAFNFRNSGEFSGECKIDYRNKLGEDCTGTFLAFDDCSTNTLELIKALRALEEYNTRYGDNARLIVSKDYIKEKSIINFETDKELSEQLSDTFIALYAQSLCTIAKANKLGHLINTQGISDEDLTRYNLSLSCRGGNLFIMKKSTNRVDENPRTNLVKLTRINKVKAKNLFNKGETILLLPCKVGLGNCWVKPVYINKSSGAEFDSIVNEFEYYNCSNSMGKYAHYYVSDKGDVH